MKTKYTIIVRDNAKKENVLELGAHGYSMRIDTNYGFNGNNTRLTIDAPVNLEEPEEKIPNVYDLDDDEVTEEIRDCRFGHSLVTSMGLFKETTYCKTCGLEMKTDEV